MGIIYKRPIKFTYYKVCLMSTESDKEKAKDYDLTNWLASVSEEDQMYKNIELTDTKVNFQELYHDPKEELYVFRVYKLRDYNVPSKIREGQSAEPIDLEDDESLGEDMTVLYDWKNSICMIQQNRMSVGVSRLAEWINKENGYDVSKKVVFYPISDHFTKNKLRNKYIRTIEFSFSNMESVNEDGPLSSIINSIGRYDGVSAKITISVGRARDAQLNPQNSYDLIEDIQKNSGCIGSARAKLKSMSDDDKARIEMVDIFETTSHDYIDFDIIEKKPLDFLQARRKMCRTYLERRKDLLSLCQR
ncbi:hypothetical protein DXB18_09495 [Clostridium sp. OM02-18AC]|nr:hypothetical protein DXB18_09495 [Clostridium sp. OM02-18AC]